MRTLSLFAFSLLLLAAGNLTGQNLRAGAATSNITPELGINIVGNFGPSFATHVHDELHARCLVLDDGSTKIALVVCDILGLRREVSVEARRLIQADIGIPPENVLISATHTHSAGSALGDQRYGENKQLSPYQAFLARRIADGVRRANNTLRPAQVAFGNIEAPEHVFNRRWFMKEGTAPPNPFGKIDKVKMNPPRASENLLEPAGPIDPTLSFIALREPDGRLISLYAAYSLHYVGGIPGGTISADYFAVFSEAMKELQPVTTPGKPPFVAMMANGTSGDINNINFREKATATPSYEQMTKVGRDLAERVHKAIPSLKWENEAKLASTYVELELQRKPLSDELKAWAEEMLTVKEDRIKGKVSLPHIYAERVKQLASRPPTVEVPLHHIRIGDIGLGSFPTETFAETGLEFRKRSPFPHAFMIEIAHDYLGYLPTPRHFELGGYETWPGTNLLEPEASVKMLNALLKLAAEQAPADDKSNVQ